MGAARRIRSNLTLPSDKGQSVLVLEKAMKTLVPPVTVACLLIAMGEIDARPAHKRSLADHYGPFLERKLNDCRTCHVPDKPGTIVEYKESMTLDDKPHNPFGARLRAVRDELRKAGKPFTIGARLDAIADEDSDKDGVANLVEIVTGHNPGEADDKPAAAEVADSSKTLTALAKFQDGYPWRPFEIVRRPIVPKVKNAAWGRNAIDAFIAAEHEELGLKPRPEASKPVLLRRVYLDLIGLPPTPEELHAFLEDTSPDAYEKVVDKLLASPRHGERWGRHWMDVWRYSDWAGYGQQIRDSQPHIWRWRDWIVESLNEDKPYDRMLLEMLAGDELAPEDPKTLRATGYLVRNYKLLSRETWMQDAVEHTSQAFLGMTLGCARCHDHMFDPISQKEYYRVRAIFEPHQVRIDKIPGQLDTTKDGLPRAYDASLDAKTVLYLRGDERTPDKDPLDPGVIEALGGRFAVESIKLPPSAYLPDRRDFVVKETIAASEQAIPKARTALATAQRNAIPAFLQTVLHDPLVAIAGLPAQRTLDAFFLAELDLPIAETKHAALLASLQAEQLDEADKKDTEAWRKAATQAAETQRRQALLEARRNLLAAQQALRTTPPKMQPASAKKVEDAEKALAKVEADAAQPLTTAYTKRPVTTYPSTSTGRRLALAKWIASPDNPLTARVAMNQIWMRHFGQAIVPSVFDFGRNGRYPSHPALLDWLAAELMDKQWSMKAIHRLVVTSSTYRMASTPDSANLAIDPDNRSLWRMNSRRMEAEVVRDCIFHVAGKLDLTMGGPEIDHNQGLTTPRRSLYFRHAQEKQMGFLKIFDAAAVTECYQRKESVLPQQALALANSELTLRHGRLLARRLAEKTGADASAFTTAAFEQVLSRSPTTEELKECLAFLKEQTERLGADKPEAPAKPEPEGRIPAADPALRARENLVHVLMNHHDFVTIR